MALGQIGPVTTVVEGLATVVAAGILLGGFSIGVAGALMGWERATLERKALDYGYLGGLLSSGALLVDLLLR